LARAGYRIFDADTHIIEPVEPRSDGGIVRDVARCSADNHAERHRSWGNQG
jgi:hypothetical protein